MKKLFLSGFMVFMLIAVYSQNLSESKKKKELGDSYDCYQENINTHPRQLADLVSSSFIAAAGRYKGYLNVLKSDDRYDVLLVDTAGLYETNTKLYLALHTIKNKKGSYSDDIDMLRDYKVICEVIYYVNELNKKASLLWSEMQPVRKKIDQEQQRNIDQERIKMIDDHKKAEEKSRKNEADEEMKFQEWKNVTHFEIPYDVALFFYENECQYCLKKCSTTKYKIPSINFSQYTNQFYMKELFSRENRAYDLLFRSKFKYECEIKGCKESRSGDHAWKVINTEKSISKMVFKN